MKFIGLVLFGLFIFGASGCSVPGKRDEPNSLASVAANKKSGTVDSLYDQYRSGTIYLDYSTVLNVEAIYKDREYREKFVEEMSELYCLDSRTVKRRREKNVEDYRNFYEFIVFVYAGTNTKVRIGKPKSEWQIFLRDSEGAVLYPSLVKKVRRRVKEVVFLDKYFQPLDRWSEVYRIRFPKSPDLLPKADHLRPFEEIIDEYSKDGNLTNAEKASLLKLAGDDEDKGKQLKHLDDLVKKSVLKYEEPVHLVVSGLRGKTVMKWSNPLLFFSGSDEFFPFASLEKTVLDKIGKEGAPDSVTNRLKNLPRKRFSTEKQLLTTLKDTLGSEDTENYKELILKNARVFKAPGDFRKNCGIPQV